MKVRDLMSTALVTATPAETVRSADVDMKIAQIRHLPVVDERGKLVGIVSDRDLLVALTKRGAVRVADVMTKHVLTVRDDTPVSRAAEMLIESGIHALPVEGEDGQLVGMVTESDFLRCFVRDSERASVVYDDDVLGVKAS